MAGVLNFNLNWLRLSVFLQRLLVLCRHSGFIHQQKWSPWNSILVLKVVLNINQSNNGSIFFVDNNLVGYIHMTLTCYLPKFECFIFGHKAPIHQSFYLFTFYRKRRNGKLSLPTILSLEARTWYLDKLLIYIMLITEYIINVLLFVIDKICGF